MNKKKLTLELFNKKIILYMFLLLSLEIFSQNVDNGESFDFYTSNIENISIPLYTINIGKISLPLYISYNIKGKKVDDLPSSLGFNWNLNVGGVIEKKINHLTDESVNGWFFDTKFNQYQNCSNNVCLKKLFNTSDSQPDFFSMKISNGEFLEFIFDKNQNGVLEQKISKQSGNFSKNNIFIDFNRMRYNSFGENDIDNYQDDIEGDIYVTNNSGLNYSFRKGVKRKPIYDFIRQEIRSDSLDYKNYYLQAIFNNQNNNNIKFEYLKTDIKKLICHSRVTRVQTNDDPQTPPNDNEPIESFGYYKDISIEDASRKEISKIITNKETIIFTYKEYNYNNYFGYLSPEFPTPYENSLMNQKVKLLDEIKIFDYNGLYILGYKFVYTNDQGNENLEGELKLKKIIKYGKNHIDNIIYKKFNYYSVASNPTSSSVTLAKDCFGYPNNALTNNQHEMLKNQTYNWSPDESTIITGMLRTIINEYGEKKEYSYKENTYQNIYYGGLLIDKISLFDENSHLIKKTAYNYEDPEGFGLKIYDESQENPPPDIYEKGYFDYFFQMNSLDTYFTKRDPTNNEGYLTAYNLRSHYYDLLKKTPLTDVFLNNLQLNQDFKQIKSGSFYKKIISTQLNVNTNQSDNGYIINYYTPSLSGFYLDKKIVKTEIFNHMNIKQRELLFNYEILQTDNQIETYKFDNVHFENLIIGNNLLNFSIENFNIYFFRDVLRSTETKIYNISGDLINESKEEISYLNENNNEANDYNKITEVILLNNNLEYEKIENRYFSEYENNTQFSFLKTLNPIIENNIWIKNNSNWLLKYSNINYYLPNGNIEKIGKINQNKNTGLNYNVNTFTPSYFDSFGNLITTVEDFIKFQYDENGKLISEFSTKNNINKYFQRTEEYNGLYIDAILTSKQTNELFFKKSFENKNEIDVVLFSKAFSGNYVFNGNSILLGDFPAGYEVSYWTYVNDKWTYNYFLHSGGSVTIIKPPNALYIDEIRIQPKNTIMETFTFKPLIGTTSILNSKGDGERKEYDIFNRPLFLLDKDHNVLKEYRYNNKVSQN